MPRINWVKQARHIPGQPGFLPDRSRLTHPDPQALIDAFAGRDQAIGNVPRGQPGFKERVDFGIVIGEAVIKQTGMTTPTTRGIIHYSQSGVHIVPSRPRTP